MVDIHPYLLKFVDQFADPGIQTVLKDFTKTIQFNFTDSHEGWLIRVTNGKDASLSKDSIEKPDILVTTTSDIMAGIMDKKVNAASAYLQRKIQVKGAMEDLLKMQKLIL
jgi:putative sterol carrier protein